MSETFFKENTSSFKEMTIAAPFVIQTERKQLFICSSPALLVLNVGGKLAIPGISI
jgi:hypothetical protein